jgi:hypothetical protein
MKTLDKKDMFYGWGIDIKFEEDTPILALPFIFLSNAFLFLAWFFISIPISIFMLLEKRGDKK